MIAIMKRNLRLFFRDRTAVFFSLLGVFIIIGLYVLFLGDLMVQGMEDVSGVRFLMDSWIMAGLLAVTSITTTMGAFGVMVDDRTKKILKDFSASPLRRRSLAAGYIASSCLVGIIMSLLALVLAEGYVVLSGGALLPWDALIKVIGCALLAVLANSAMVFFIVSFLKSQSAFATASTVLGTLVGFLTGIYIPIGTLPEAVQTIVKIFPVSHAGALLRQIMMEVPMAEMGVIYSFGSQEVSALASILVLVATAGLFYGLAIINLSRKGK